MIFTLIRMRSRPEVARENQSSLGAGPIGTPIAEYLSPDSVEYAQPVANHDFANHDFDTLDQGEDDSERQL